ncbi:50S ribosomal protein L11 [Candidatus Shapirobacteria bacterium]|nr:MAG: 50S ribosomal protein L11 [Candidatus Shapirobacteria bacterium]
MPKKISAVVRLTIPAGTATPAPPVGTALGPHGIKMQEFCSEFNAKTKDKKGSLIPAVITIYEDRSFDFIVKEPPVSDMIKKKLGLQKGSQKPPVEKVGTLTQSQLEEIAKAKMPDFNTTDINMAKKIVAGTAKSMGVTIATK